MEIQEAAAERGDLLATITSTIVGLYKRYYGKGPAKGRSYIVDNLVICALRGGMTRAEETLARSGRAELVSQQRQELQAAVRDEFVEAIEQLVGRRVLAFMSTTDTNPDISVEIFMLEPEPASDRGSSSPSQPPRGEAPAPDGVAAFLARRHHPHSA